MSKRDTLVISNVSFSHSETAKDLLMFIFMLSSRFLEAGFWRMEKEITFKLRLI